MRSLSRARRLAPIHTIELLEVLSDILLDQGHPCGHLAGREVAIAVVNCLELAAVDCNRSLGEQVPAPAEHDELAAHALDGCGVLSSEVGDGLKVRREPTHKPHQLKIAPRLLLQPT